MDDTRYYHYVSRCVRRAFLCGKDPYTGQSYEHRRWWVQERLLSLAQVFVVVVIAFALMSNHTHVVLYVNADQANSWRNIITLPCHLNDYLDLVEFTGRAVRDEKAGHISQGTVDLLTRLEIDLDNWMELTQGFEYQFHHLVGREHSMRQCRQVNGLTRIRGSTNAKRLFA